MRRKAFIITLRVSVL
jgi:Adenylate kinase (EC 2.7.4.3)